MNTFTCSRCLGRDRSIYGSAYHNGQRICRTCVDTLKSNPPEPDPMVCDHKHRWPDELSAAAGALRALERPDADVKQLWVYKCPHCRGWHLTKNIQLGKEPITLKELDK